MVSALPWQPTDISPCGSGARAIPSADPTSICEAAHHRPLADTNVSTDTIVQSIRLQTSGVMWADRLLTGGGHHDPIRGSGVHRPNPPRPNGRKMAGKRGARAHSSAPYRRVRAAIGLVQAGSV